MDFLSRHCQGAMSAQVAGDRPFGGDPPQSSVCHSVGLYSQVLGG